MNFRIVFVIALVSVLFSIGYTLDVYADHVNIFGISGWGGDGPNILQGVNIAAFVDDNHGNTNLRKTSSGIVYNGWHESAYNAWAKNFQKVSDFHEFLDTRKTEDGEPCFHVGFLSIRTPCRVSSLIPCDGDSNFLMKWNCAEVAIDKWPNGESVAFSHFVNYPSTDVINTWVEGFTITEGLEGFEKLPRTRGWQGVVDQ